MASVAMRLEPASVREDSGDAGRLFAEYSGQIYGYCLRRLGSRSEAEDAVQTTFLYALRALRRGVVPECEPAWLTAIAKNVCRWQRRTLDRRGPLASDADLDRIALARPDGDEEELLLGLKDALASIPEKQRRALVLREWQGLPAREIATRLDMSPTATHALLTRARRSLAQALTTSSRRPVLGLDFGTLFFQLRLHIKALLGGASAKAVAATAIAVVGVGIGGVSIERALDDGRSTPRGPTRLAPADLPGAAWAAMATSQAGNAGLAGAIGEPIPDALRNADGRDGSWSPQLGETPEDPGSGPAGGPAPTDAPGDKSIPSAAEIDVEQELGPDLALPEILSLVPPSLPGVEPTLELIPPPPELPPALSAPEPPADELPIQLGTPELPAVPL